MLSTLVFWIAARLYVLPRLHELTPLGTVTEASAYIGPAYWILAYWVPALLVTHYIVFLVLLRHWKRAASA